MESQFICNSCNKIFDAESVRKEYTDPVFGACMKYVADCPDCGDECPVYRKPKPQKAKKGYCDMADSMPPCGESPSSCSQCCME